MSETLDRLMKEAEGRDRKSGHRGSCPKCGRENEIQFVIALRRGETTNGKNRYATLKTRGISCCADHALEAITVVEEFLGVKVSA